mmetsp:Transcript_10255/g.27950  ORF Transcript_10255/g.27950 Transcript_10255/m.27950 type:complete len:94 (+) Transcript_10255:1398-1679(+)
MAGPARPLSGLQRHVLSLFRRCIRAARVKDSQQQGSSDEVALGSWQAYVRAQFEQHRGLKPIRDHMLVEYHMRRGQKALELLSKPEVKGIQQS